MYEKEDVEIGEKGVECVAIYKGKEGLKERESESE